MSGMHEPKNPDAAVVPLVDLVQIGLESRQIAFPQLISRSAGRPRPNQWIRIQQTQHDREFSFGRDAPHVGELARAKDQWM